MNAYRRLFTTARELTRLRAKYDRPESEAELVERRSRWIFEATMTGENPQATGALVTQPEDPEPDI